MTAPRKAAVATKTTAAVTVEPEYIEPYEVPDDSLAAELVKSGAAPVEVDVPAMIASMQAMMDKQSALIAQLMADRGIPTDPIAAQIQALQDHLAVQATANPYHTESYKAVRDYASALNSDNLTVNQTTKLRNLVDDLPAHHELGYVRHLAKDLHNTALDSAE